MKRSQPDIPTIDPVPTKRVCNEFTSSSSDELEALGVHPDVYQLFREYDHLFFEGMLSARGVCVSWSKRMTLCAGLCRFEPRQGICDIKLSEKLLQYRTPKELRETLAHEMIHAEHFLKGISDSRDGHGPAFQAKMNAINQVTGLNITVYHSFHDEVDYHRNHIWKCNGPCQNRPPYFGLVKRAMNRAPSSRDPWWRQHELTCGGEYTKISEPQNKSKTRASAKKAAGTRSTSGRPRTQASTSIEELDTKEPTPWSLLDDFLIPHQTPQQNQSTTQTANFPASPTPCPMQAFSDSALCSGRSRTSPSTGALASPPSTHGSFPATNVKMSRLLTIPKLDEAPVNEQTPHSLQGNPPGPLESHGYRLGTNFGQGDPPSPVSRVTSPSTKADNAAPRLIWDPVNGYRLA